MDELLSHYVPPLGMRSRHIQSLLASSAIRRRLVMRHSAALR